VPLANDTACGVGFAPLTDLERVVLAVERRLNSSETKRAHPEIGEDIKVMGIRRGERLDLTIGCAFVSRFITDIDDYLRKVQAARELALNAAHRAPRHAVHVILNAADDPARGEIFLTVTGTSAEAGDDGEAGRGNRASGLITPYRPMAIEAVAGKNPSTHVGKLYQLLAGRIAEAIPKTIPEVADAECVLVGEIGRPISEPRIADVCVGLEADEAHRLTTQVEDIVRSELARLPDPRDDILSERVAMF
jgi:S-adenosylmethionine synthetase